MICTHDFVRIAAVSKMPKGEEGIAPMFRAVPGAEVGCLKCGQVRRVYADGFVEVSVEGGTPIAEDAPAA